MINQDSINVFQNPVDSVRVAAQDVTSEKITNLLDFTESMGALWNLVHVEYIFFICVSYYIVVTRVKGVRTNSVGRRNLLLFFLTIVWGLVGYLWRGTPILNLLVTGLCVNAFYEFIFKSVFKTLERFGITPLPGWHVEEIRTEKQNDINKAEQVKKQPHYD
jgi:hypothetical protein